MGGYDNLGPKTNIFFLYSPKETPFRVKKIVSVTVPLSKDRPDISLVKYSVSYWISGRISGRIPDFWT